jgi:type IV fimbrial biogenesis protein FimT
MAKNPLYAGGFTIVELMTTLAIAAILAAIAAPSFTAIIQDNRLVTQVNELQASIALARSEAIKLNNNVTVCRSSNGSSCTGNWQNGWIVFSDNDFDGVFDAADLDTLLRVHGPISAGNSITFTQNRVIYNGSGLVRGSSDGIFTVCDDRGATSAKAIIISTTGRARLAIDSNANNIVEDDSGTDVTCP